MKRIILAISIIIAFLIIGSCLIYGRGIYTGFALMLDDLKDFSNWREKTSPLNGETLSDLCNKFNLPRDDGRCISGAVVYAPEFSKTIIDFFQPETGHTANFDEVEKIIGDYKFDIESLTKVSNGIEYFRVWYDFNGDHVFPIVFYFYSDGNLWKIDGTSLP